MATGSRRAIYAALAANLGIAIAKFAGYLFTHSASLLAEAVHSMADTGNQVLLLWGSSAATRAPSPTHPFGYGRERFFWSFVVALVLFSLGGLFAIVHGVEKLGHAQPLNEARWAVGILVLGLLLEAASLRTAVMAARPLKGNRSWWTFVRQTKNPELPVVLLEDLGALLGLLIALIGVVLTLLTGDPTYDAGASIVIGGLLALIAGVLAVEMKSLLIGEGAHPRHLETIHTALQATGDVQRIIHVRTQHIGPDELLVGAKVEFESTLDFEQLTHAIDRTEAKLREALPQLELTIYLEPDVYEPQIATGAVATDRS